MNWRRIVWPEAERHLVPPEGGLPMLTVINTAKNIAYGRSAPVRRREYEGTSENDAGCQNMELAGCYHQEPMSFPALYKWCEEQAEKFKAYICDTGEFLDESLKKGKKSFWRHSLER